MGPIHRVLYMSQLVENKVFEYLEQVAYPETKKIEFKQPSNASSPTKSKVAKVDANKSLNTGRQISPKRVTNGRQHDSSIPTESEILGISTPSKTMSTEPLASPKKGPIVNAEPHPVEEKVPTPEVEAETSNNNADQEIEETEPTQKQQGGKRKNRKKNKRGGNF